MPDDTLLPTTLGELPAYAARRWGDRTAIEFQGTSWSFGALSAEVDRTAAGLMAAGVGAKDRVALLITNRPEFLVAFFAVLRLGAVAVPLNTRWRTRDLAFAMRHSDAVALISEASAGPIDFECLVRDALGGALAGEDGTVSSASCPSLRLLIFLSDGRPAGGLRWDDLPRETALPSITVNPDDMALLLYTSGTTGTPKGVMLSHIGLPFSQARARALGVTETDVHLNYLPLFHIYSLIFAVLPSLLTGAKQVLMARFDASEALRLIAQHRVTILHGLETHYRDLLRACHAPGASPDTSSLRWGTFAAGAQTARAVALEVQRSLCRTISTYGQSESWGAITSGPVGCSIEQSCDASGAPLPGVELRIVDPSSGADVAPGEVGGILVRSRSVMIGYYKAEAETRAVLDADGWLQTGDAGCLRPDGHLRFIGRYKDMLKVGGENVDPAEVEALLLECPLVSQVAVVGCPDERLSEIPAAFVVPAVGADQEEVRQALDALCRGAIASFKIPRRVEFISAMPINASGKVDKKLLRQLTASPWAGASQCQN